MTSHQRGHTRQGVLTLVLPEQQASGSDWQVMPHPAPSAMHSPRSWVPSIETGTNSMGVPSMKPENNGQGRHGESDNAGMPCPPTLLVAELIDGGVYLQGWPVGPNAYLGPDDAKPLKRELASAFGSEDSAPPAGTDGS